MGSQKHKREYWSKERCAEVAKQCTSRMEFKKKFPAAYKICCLQGWLDEVCNHMTSVQKPHGFWTKQRCQIEANKYATKTDFAKNSRGAYKAAYRNGWLNEICGQMISTAKPNGYWTKERCYEEARKYETRMEFRNKCQSAYNAAYTHGWLDEICSQMIVKMHTFTKEECTEEAKKYSRKIDFMNGSPHHYSWAIRHKFLREICKFMKPQGNLNLRKIYVFEFSDNHAYVGLAQDTEKREKEHQKDKSSTVYKYIKKTQCPYVFKVLTEFLNKDEAAEQEDIWINRYAEMGWIMINKKPGGDLGYGPQKYTKEDCAREAKNHLYRKDFKAKNSILYNYAAHYGWLEEICKHMDRFTKPVGYWTKEKCLEAALKFSYRKEFQKNESGAYCAALKHGWLKEICKHMPLRVSPDSFWTKERCHIEALKCSTRKEFQEKNGSAYNSARKNKWLDSICGHMEQKVKPVGYWTKERCMIEAKKNYTIRDFRRNSPSAYAIAWKKGWLQELKLYLERI